MAGTLVASSVNDGTDTGSTTDMIHGSAKAWVSFDGVGVPAIFDSYNVSSITDLGTGQFGVNFATAMPDANYSVVGSGNNVALISTLTGTYPTSTTQARITSQNSSGSLADRDSYSVAIFR